MTISIYNAHQILLLQLRCPHRSLYLSMEASWYTCIHEIVVASWQLASVAWSVGQRTALESQGHRFSSGAWNCIFCFCTCLSLINIYKFPLDNFHLQYQVLLIHMRCHKIFIFTHILPIHGSILVYTLVHELVVRAQQLASAAQFIRAL
jgi:hypothetical protein